MADGQLTQLVKQAKSAPRKCIIAVKGAHVTMGLSKRNFSAKQKKDVKDEAGSAKAYVGVLEAEESGGFVFKAPDVPPNSLSKAVLMYIRKETGINLRSFHFMKT